MTFWKPLAIAAVPLALACSPKAVEPSPPAKPPDSAPPAKPPAPIAGSETDAGAPAPEPPAACPDGMEHVTHDFCPKMQRHCAKSEYDKSNHITICHRFKEGAQECLADRIPLDFCIDRYEFPNAKGEPPLHNLNFKEAKLSCSSVGR